MNLDCFAGALSQIRYLVVNVNKKNFNYSVQEIKEIVTYCEAEAEQYLYQVVLDQLEWLNSSDSRSTPTNISSASNSNGIAGLCVITTGKEKESTEIVPTLGFSSSNSSYIIQLVQLIAASVPLHRFATNLSFAIASPLAPDNSKLSVRSGWVSSVSAVLKLSRVQEVAVCIQLLHSSIQEIRNQATSILKPKLIELVNTYIDAESSGRELSELSSETLHLSLTHSAFSEKDSTFPHLLDPGINWDFIITLQKEFERSSCPIVLLPLLYPDSKIFKESNDLKPSTDMAQHLIDESLADIMRDMGYNFCSTIEDCKTHLTSYGISSLTPAIISRAIGLMIKTSSNFQSEQVSLQSLADPAGLWSDKEKLRKNENNLQSPIGSHLAWNMDVFVKVILEFVPNLSIKEVICEFDHKGFIVKDRAGLTLLVKAIILLLQGQGLRPQVIPVEYFYRPWKHSEEQVLLLSQILSNPDIFYLMDYQCSIVNTDGLKSVPDPDNKDLFVWKNLSLLETLLTLADHGQSTRIKELLKFPMSQCPDILMMGLTQVSIQRSTIRQEVISNLVQIYLGPNVNSSIILHNLWNMKADDNMVQKIIIQAMSDWYMIMEYDQTRLARILDIAQDLKALPFLLNAEPFTFMIDLACLACRREYLKLEKWICDKVREHGEAFVGACVHFLTDRCPQLVGKKEEPKGPANSALPKETITCMVTCLHSYATNVSQELMDTIVTMVNSCTILARPKQMSLMSTSTLGFPGQGEGLSSLASNLGNLALGTGSSASLFPNSNPINISSMGAIGQSRPVTSISQTPQPLPSQPLPSILGTNISGLLKPNSTDMRINSNPVSSAASSLSLNEPSTRTGGKLLALSKILELPASMPKEAEDEANGYFQKIYNLPPNPTLSVSEALDMLGKFQHSNNNREKMVYLCMLKNLFEEYRYFPSYPPRELLLTAKLFGGMIDQGFVEFMSLGIALRYVMEALAGQHASNMYYFGLVALDKFKTKMKDYPRYCLHITTNVEHFNQFPPHLIEYLNYGVKGILPPQELSGEVLPPQLQALQVDSYNSVPKALTTSDDASRSLGGPIPGVGKPSITSTSIDTLLDAAPEKKFSPPPENIQEKFSFIFNNLSLVNIAQKCEEIKEEIVDDNMEWLAQYLVMKRVSIEPNFHNLYSTFLDSLRIPRFSHYVIQETLRNVKVILRADKAVINMSDKSLLKNLGHWLGLLTLAKNKPILHIDIDMKSLLLEAYKKGFTELQYIIPFVSKVLESCGRSKVFKPPNPWTMAILNVLAELHAEPDMKLHLKFEIEVLCNRIEISLTKDLKPGNLIKNEDKLSKLKPQLSQPDIGKRPESTPIFPAQEWQSGQERRRSAIPSNPVTHKPELYKSDKEPSNLAPQSSSATPTPPVPDPIQMIAQQPIEQRFHYKDITINSLRCIDPHITVSSQPYGLENNAQVRNLIRHSIELAINEITNAVVDRSIKVAMTTADHLIKKDFALEPDERNMRQSTHHLVRNLSSAQVMMPCKDHVHATIAKYVKQNFLNSLNRHNSNPQQTEQLEALANSTANEACGVVCAFIQKTAAEKAVNEMDKRLAPEYEARKMARNEGKRYFDARVLQYHTDRMPEAVRLKVGGITRELMQVYVEFGRNIPGFLPRSDPDLQEGFDYYVTKPVATVGHAYISEDPATGFNMYAERICSEIDTIMTTLSTLQPGSSLIPMLHSLQEGVQLCRANRDATADQLLMRRSIEHIFEGARIFNEDPDSNNPQISAKFRDVHLLSLKAISDLRSFGAPWSSKFITKCWTEVREEIRYNLDGLDWLLKAGLLNIKLVDEHLSHSFDDISQMIQFHPPFLFLCKLVQHYFIDNAGISGITESDLPQCTEKLMSLYPHRHQLSDAIINVMDGLKIKQDVYNGTQNLVNVPDNVSSRGTMLHFSSNQHFQSGVGQAKDFNDPPGLQEKTEHIFQQWGKIFHSPDFPLAGQSFQIIVKEMDINGILKTDELITRFLRISLTLCREICVRSVVELSNTSGPNYARNKCFPHVDAFVRLIACLIKQSGEHGNPAAKINLLNKVLGLICGIMLHDIESNGENFHQLPYHRLLIMLFLDLNAPETVLEAINLPVLAAFTQTLRLLRPSKCPGFAYAWLEIVSHRVFIGRMLAITPEQKGWGMYSTLLTDLFKFLAPFLRNVELSKPFTTLYKGTLRVLLVLLHDFPEFLCEYHFLFCDVIPPNCIQMRNLILSAYPRKMRLPDPFMANLRVERLSEIKLPPKMHAAPEQILGEVTFKADVDSYLKNRTPVTFLSELRKIIQTFPVQVGVADSGYKYNMGVINALVLYVGTQAIDQISSKGGTPSMATIAHSAHMDIFENLSVDLDTEGRYLFLVAIANQLRYPNSHTHYFSCVLLYLFSEANTEAIQEQITRVLLERLIGNRPQPWGLLITFIELLKNPAFKFWSHEFVKCAPEIEKIFESVARSCCVTKNQLE